MRLRAVLGLLFAGMMPLCLAATAQEPAMIHGRPGVRFEEGPDRFHYVIPCDMAVKGAPGGAPVPGLCWPVGAVYVHLEDGKTVQSTRTAGILLVSADRIRFFADGTLPPDNPAPDFSRAEVVFKHEAGASTAVVATREEGYAFAFQDVCFECKGSPVPGEPAQMDKEFGLMQEALTNYVGVRERLVALSQQKRVKVTPADEPGLPAISKNLGLWSDLNRKLAAACTDPAKTCLQSYAEFQACAANPHAGCAMVKPSCTAVCVLPSTFDMQGILASAPPQLDALQLVPAGLEIAGIAGGSPGGVMGGMPGPVEGLHAPTKIPKAILMMEDAPPPPGVAGGVLGGAGATGITVQAGPLKPGVARISAGVMAGRMVNRVQPVYPPVARAAHMSGMVVMRAIISKQGTVESLDVVSTTSALFNQAAIDAVKQWQYKPYLLNGEPTEVDTTITVSFNLGGPPAAPRGAPAAVPAPAVPPS